MIESIHAARSNFREGTTVVAGDVPREQSSVAQTSAAKHRFSKRTAAAPPATTRSARAREVHHGIAVVAGPPAVNRWRVR
jgi:hypothetical protein